MSTQTCDTLALTGGPRAVTLPAPKWPRPDEVDVTRMAEVVRSGNWSWIGPNERAFCEEYRTFIGSRYCIGLANGTVTLQCALQAVGVVPGDEVIVPGLTWVATAQAALDIGADVVLVDIDPETLCISPEAIKAAITPRTKAIVPVHLYGCMCDMDAIMAIAKEHRLAVVEDVAHQHGSQWRGVGAGAIGDVGSFSFQQSKVLSSGEGGAVTCNRTDIYKTVFALKQVGWTVADPETDPFGALEPGKKYGHNYRLTEFQAAILRGGLSRLPEETRLRERNARTIAAELAKTGGPLRVARRDERVTRQAYYALTLHFDPAKAPGVSKARYMEALNREGVPVNGTYWPVYASPLLNLYDATSPVPFRDQARIQNYRTLKLPNVERAFNETAMVMTHVALLGGSDYIAQIIAAIRKVNANLDALRQ